MYKVQKYWKAYRGAIEGQLAALPASASKATVMGNAQGLSMAAEEPTDFNASKRRDLQQQLAFMDETDMAVIVSQQQNEVDLFKEKGLDIAPHRLRMVKEDMETKFKDAEDPFRLVFVCAMWLTGFDAPAVSTIYLDKPMKNHTLMQTIARANRVFGEKNNGLIVDYVGVFRNLQKALAIYGSSSGGGVGAGECPVQKKDELVEELRLAIAEALSFCEDRGVDVHKIIAASPQNFEKIKEQDSAAVLLVDAKVSAAIDDAVEQTIVNDELKQRTRADVYSTVRTLLDELPRAYTPELYQQKCDAVYQHVYDSYQGEGQSIYSREM